MNRPYEWIHIDVAITVLLSRVWFELGAGIVYELRRFLKFGKHFTATRTYTRGRQHLYPFPREASTKPPEMLLRLPLGGACLKYTSADSSSRVPKVVVVGSHILIYAVVAGEVYYLYRPTQSPYSYRNRSPRAKGCHIHKYPRQWHSSLWRSGGYAVGRETVGVGITPLTLVEVVLYLLCFSPIEVGCFR